MANMMPGIRNSWTLVSFVRANGKLKYCPNMVNKDTGETFSSLACVNSDGSVNTFIHFSQNLGTLSAEQIAAQKDKLQVVELESGTYSLCKQGDSANAWQDIDI